MSKTRAITVGDVREAIKNLPNTDFVIFTDTLYPQDREVTGVGPVSMHAGAVGPSLAFLTNHLWFRDEKELLTFVIGGFVPDDSSFTDYEHEIGPGDSPFPTVPMEPFEDADIPEYEAAIQKKLSKYLP